jgi:von Willebrand factor type A domain
MKSLTEPELADPLADDSTATKLRRSPLTDPRALVCSLLIHATLLVVASFLAFRVAAPVIEPTSGRVMKGELDATDNRAMGEPGGTAGDPEGRAADLSAEPGIPAPLSKNDAADALLSEILPTRETTEIPSQTLPGPSTSGLGMLNATGSGEGGDASGNTVGGGGKGGPGPGTEFFGVRDKGRSFAYVIDCSGSMTARGSLNVAKRELLWSLDQISPDARFAVVFYNLEAKVFTDPAGNPGLMAATPANKARVKTLLATIQADGGTDHMIALKTAFDLHPEVIFFLTDADLMSRQDVEELVALAGKTRIQAIEFGQVTGLGGSAPLKLLARSTGGTYQYVDVNRFVR